MNILQIGLRHCDINLSANSRGRERADTHGLLRMSKHNETKGCKLHTVSLLCIQAYNAHNILRWNAHRDWCTHGWMERNRRMLHGWRHRQTAAWLSYCQQGMAKATTRVRNYRLRGGLNYAWGSFDGNNPKHKLIWKLTIWCGANRVRDSAHHCLLPLKS